MISEKKQPSFSPALPYIAIIVSVILWGGSFTAMRQGIRELNAFGLMSLRFLSAALVLIPFLPRFISSFRQSAQKGDGRLILIMVLLQPCLYFLFESNALRFTTASQAGVVSAIAPLLTAVGAWVFLKESINKQVISGMIIAVAGIVIVTFGGSPDSGALHPLLGNMLELFAMVSAAGYLVAVRGLSRRYDTWLLTAMQIFTGAFFFLPGIFTVLNSKGDFLSLPWLPILYLGIASSIAAFGLFNWGMKYVSAGKASSFINLIPVIAAFASWLLIGEKLSFLQITGTGIVLSGVLISQKRSIRVLIN